MAYSPDTVGGTAGPLRVLVLEDSARDAELIVRELRSFGYEPQWTRVETEEDFRKNIDSGLQLILADYTLPQFDALSALRIMQERGLSIPFIVVTGTITEATAVAVLKQGADDYLLKDRLGRLGPAVKSALEQGRMREERKRAEQALRDSEARLQTAQQIGAIGDWEFDRQTRACILSPQMYRLFERDPAQGAPGPNEIFEYYFPESAQLTRDCARRALDTGESAELEQRVRLPSGRTAFHASVILAGKDAEGRVVKLYGTSQDITARKRLEEERAANVARLAELSRRVVAVQEEERRRLAAELHDHTSPSLSAVSLNLGLIAADLPPQASNALASRFDDTRTLLADSIAAIRDVCADLRPATLDYVGLNQALKEYAGQFSRRTGIAVHVSGMDSRQRLAAETETMLFRVAQEALTNCAKHAKATSISMEITHASEQVVLEISDNGAGFDPGALGQSRHRPGLGLLTMRERAEFAGGKFSLESQPGKGTRIRVEI